MDYAQRCRDEIYDGNKFLMSKILVKNDTERQKLNVNCGDFGRIRYFQYKKFEDWNVDPIPFAPASKKISIDLKIEKLPVQMFEIAKCNLNCWWCYLPKEIQINKEKYTKWLSAGELLNLFEAEKNDCKIIYLSGGNPELVPEYIYEFMKELEKRQMDKEFFLWSDDVLTTDFTEKYLSKEKLNYLINYSNYAKVCCLKGFDSESFAYNSNMRKELFNVQLTKLEKYVRMGLDIYGYIILVTPNVERAEEKIKTLMDKLQKISKYLPLRIIPIKIEIFSAVVSRMTEERELSLLNQYKVLKLWNKELKRRFSTKEMNTNIAELII